MITAGTIYDSISAAHPKVSSVYQSAGNYLLRFAPDTTQLEMDAANLALPGVVTSLQTAIDDDETARADLDANVAAILARLDAGLTAVASDQAALAAATTLAQVKPIVTRMLNREDALYSDLKPVIRFVAKSAR